MGCPSRLFWIGLFHYSSLLFVHVDILAELCSCSALLVMNSTLWRRKIFLNKQILLAIVTGKDQYLNCLSPKDFHSAVEENSAAVCDVEKQCSSHQDIQYTCDNEKVLLQFSLYCGKNVNQTLTWSCTDIQYEVNWSWWLQAAHRGPNNIMVKHPILGSSLESTWLQGCLLVIYNTKLSNEKKVCCPFMLHTT